MDLVGAVGLAISGARSSTARYHQRVRGYDVVREGTSMSFERITIDPKDRRFAVHPLPGRLDSVLRGRALDRCSVERPSKHKATVVGLNRNRVAPIQLPPPLIRRPRDELNPWRRQAHHRVAFQHPLRQTISDNEHIDIAAVVKVTSRHRTEDNHRTNTELRIEPFGEPPTPRDQRRPFSATPVEHSTGRGLTHASSPSASPGGLTSISSSTRCSQVAMTTSRKLVSVSKARSASA